jgi:hypothetical protein
VRQICRLQELLSQITGLLHYYYYYYYIMYQNCAIAEFLREAADIYALLRNYAASIGDFLLTLLKNLSVPSSGPIGFPETSVIDYH